jgi:hypothetical protein
MQVRQPCSTGNDEIRTDKASTRSGQLCIHSRWDLVGEVQGGGQYLHRMSGCFGRTGRSVFAVVQQRPSTGFHSSYSPAGESRFASKEPRARRPSCLLIREHNAFLIDWRNATTSTSCTPTVSGCPARTTRPQSCLSAGFQRGSRRTGARTPMTPDIQSPSLITDCSPRRLGDRRADPTLSVDRTKWRPTRCGGAVGGALISLIGCERSGGRRRDRWCGRDRVIAR